MSVWPERKISITCRNWKVSLVILSLLISLVLAGSYSSPDSAKESARSFKFLNRNLDTDAKVLTQSQKASAEIAVQESGIFGAIWAFIVWICEAIWWCLVQLWELIKILPWPMILKITGIVIAAVIFLGLVGWIVGYFWLKYKQGTNYDYNIFDDPEHSTASKLAFGRMRFQIPAPLKDRVKSVSTAGKGRSEQLQFSQPDGEFIALILNTKVGKCRHYKYFEFELVENPSDCKVYMGLCEWNNFRNDALPKSAPSTVILNGSKGIVKVGKKSKKFDFHMRNFGDVGGILLFKDQGATDQEAEVIPTCNGRLCENMDMPDDLKSEISLKEMGYSSNAKKAMTKADLKKFEKDKSQKEKRRKKERKEYKLYIPNNVDLYPFFACEGQCSVDINLGSEIFHCSNDDFNRGIMQ